MSKIEVLKIEVSALKDLDVDQEIFIPQNTVVGIVGINEDDSGSNAAGKSSVAMAIPLNLFGPKYVGVSAKDLKNRHLKSPVKTVGYYKINDIDLKVCRTLGGELAFTYGNEPEVTGAVDDVQEKLITTLGMTPNQILMLSYKDQKTPTKFLLMNDAEKKEFLSSFVDDSKFEGVYETLLKEITTINDSIIKKKATSEYLSLTNIPRTESKIASKKEEFEAFLKDSSLKNEKLDLEIASLEYDIKQLEEIDVMSVLQGNPEFKKLNNEKNLLEDQNKKDLEILDSEVSLLRTEIENLSNDITKKSATPSHLILQESEASKNLTFLRTLQKSHSSNLNMLNWKLEEVDALEKSLSNPNKAICNHCSQELPVNEQEKHQSSLKLSLDLKKKELEALFLKCEENSDIEARVSKAESILLDAKSAISTYSIENSPENLKKEISLKESRLKIILQEKKQKDIAVQEIDRQIKLLVEQAKRDFESTKNSLSSSVKSKINEKLLISNEVERFTETIKAINTELSVMKSELSYLDSEISSLNKNVEIKTHAKNAVSKDGAIAYLFDEILEDLNSEINKNLKVFPNAQKFSLFFLPEKTTKSTGNVSKNITFTLFEGGNEISIKTVSGGEEMSILTAVDEALDSVLERRMGFFVGWKILDEQMGFIDHNTKEAILDFYKEKSHNKTYIIIDHGSELNASFESQIVVRKKNKIARVEN